MPNVLSPSDLVSRPDNMDETVLQVTVLFFHIGLLTKGSWIGFSQGLSTFKLYASFLCYNFYVI